MPEMSPQAEVGAASKKLRRQGTKRRSSRSEGEKAWHASGKKRHSLPLSQRVTLRIGQLIHGNQDQVDYPPDATTAQGDVPETVGGERRSGSFYATS
jgi:hypothetical protein